MYLRTEKLNSITAKMKPCFFSIKLKICIFANPFFVFEGGKRKKLY